MRGRAVVRRLVARSTRRIPERALPVLLQARSLLGQGPALGLPRFSRPLVLAPHPDDETIVCGGLVALLAQRGAHVVVAFVTDGDASRGSPLQEGKLGRRRRDEATRACAVLGVDDVRFLGFPDGGVQDRLEALRATLDALLDECRPDAVLLPSFLDAHPDHRAVNLALTRTRLDRAVQVWGGEAWTPVPATRLVDVTQVSERTRQALACHVTAREAFELEAMLSLNRYRSVHGLQGRGYAEAFLAGSAGDYVSWAETFLRDAAR